MSSNPMMHAQYSPEPSPNPMPSSTNSPYDYGKYENPISPNLGLTNEYNPASSSASKSEALSPNTPNQPGETAAIVEEPNSEQPPANSKVTVCWRDVQTGLTILAWLDMIMALICLIVFIVLLEEGIKNYQERLLAVMAICISSLMTIFSIPLVFAAFKGSRVTCCYWTFYIFGWILFMSTFIFYTLLIFVISFPVGIDVMSALLGFYGVLWLAFVYRVYVTVAIWRYNKELIKRTQTEVPGSVYYNPASYEPVNGYDPYGGFGQPGYGGVGGTYDGSPYYSPDPGAGVRDTYFNASIGSGIGLAKDLNKSSN